MKKILFLFVSIHILYRGYGFAQKSDSLYAFTHPMFFYSMQCECSRFNFDYIYLSLYDTNAQYSVRTVIPANFDVGHGVIIVDKIGDYFKIKFCPGARGDYEQDLVGKEFCVAKGQLGTWLYNFNETIGEYDSIPLYETPSLNSKIITKVESENSVAVILDIIEDWMLVETIGKKKEKGWLCPQMQCGSPTGIDANTCY